MRKLILISSAAVSMFVVGCASPQSVCETNVDQACERTFACNSDTAKASDAFKTAYGANLAECKTKLYAAAQCAEKKSMNDNCTGDSAGKTFDLNKASQCLDERAQQTCADYEDASKTPGVCQQVCN